jgi:hypothetical protein
LNLTDVPLTVVCATGVWRNKMTKYITQEQAAALAKASGFTVHRGLGLATAALLEKFND